MNKTRILTISDDPFAGTGFSEELRNIMFRLAQTDKYDVYWISLQTPGYEHKIYDREYPDLRPAGSYITLLGGHGYRSDILTRHILKYKPEIVFIIGDPHHFEPVGYQKKNEPFVFIGYTTLDGIPIYPHWNTHFENVDFPIAMSEWAYKEFNNYGIRMAAYIHHGVSWQYTTVSDVEKYKIRRELGIKDDETIFIQWESNQFRKRQDALLRSWRDFHPERKKAKLFLNTDSSCQLGWRIKTLMKQYNVPENTVILPEDISPYGSKKFFDFAEDPIVHKQLCSIGDVYVSTTGGEGFGKAPLEAMSMRMPVIITDYSACSEVCEKGSILVPTYEGRAGRFRFPDERKCVEMGIVNEEKFTEAIQYMYDHPAERRELGMEAREWSKEFDYDTKIFPGWEDILSRINVDSVLATQLLKYE